MSAAGDRTRSSEHRTEGAVMTESLADAVEAELVDLSYRLTEPGERECLRCYLLRMIEQCDCEVILNVYPYYPDSGRLLPCAGVLRAGSSVPCDLSSGLRRSA